MTDCQEDIDRLILDIHAAPLEPDRWQLVVDSVCHVAGADKGLLFSVPRTQGATFWNISSELGDEVTAEYSAEFAPEDIWMLEVQSRGATSPGTIFVGEELVDRRRFLKTRFFNEFLLCHDIDRFMNVALLPSSVPRSPPAATFSLYRACGREAFGTHEREIFERLAPHLILAVNTFWKTRELLLHNAALSQTLDSVTTPLFVVDRSGRLLFANAAGEAALRAGDCLSVVSGCLAPSPSVRERKVCNEALRNLLIGHASTVSLSVGIADRQVILSTAPISESVGAFAPGGPSAGLVWLVPVTQTANSVKRIASLFGLTRAEARLLAHLSGGLNLTETGKALCISIHTARSQLKAIQRKTGWRSQGELIRMVQQLGVINPKG